MTVATYILGVVSALITLAVVIEMLRRRRLRERHAVWWLVAGTLALIIGVFPSTLIWAARLIGVEVPLSLNTVKLRVWMWIWGLWAGCGQWVWWSRLASHLEILRLITRGFERFRRAGLRRPARLRMAWRQVVPVVSGC